MTLKIRALGEFQLELDGTDVTAQLDATRIFLLTYLLDCGRQPRAHLAELLWPERPTGRARSNLRTLITRLRPLLTPYLQTETASIALPQTGQVWFDVHEFSTLVQRAEQLTPDDPTRIDTLTKAVALFQGDFLATVAGGENEALESWLMTRRLQLHGQAVQILRKLVHTNTLPLGQRLDHARQLITLEPLDEEGCRTLMRLLAESGRRDEALWHFQRYQRDLVEVWSSATPSEELVMMAAKIRLGMAVSSAAAAPHEQTATDQWTEQTHPLPTQSASNAVAAPQPAPTAPGAAAEAPQAQFRPFPAPLKPLIGRRQEREQLLQWLSLGYRLIAVTGLGGIGKSHFVQTVVAAEQQRWRTGALYVTLPEPAVISETSQRAPNEQQQTQSAILFLCQALAVALEIPLQSSQGYTDLIAQTLAPYAGCLVIDNFERALPAAPFLQTLLARAGGLTVIVCSRQPLQLTAQAQIALRGLPMRAEAQAAPATSIAHTAAREQADGTAEELLLLNLIRHHPGFQLREEERPLLREICQAVHGLPLALEMAPVLVRHLPLREVAARLRTQPLTLAADFADLPAQHRSLYALMDATFMATAQSIQEALVSLAVFAGPFTAEMARCVINDKQLIELKAQGWLETVDTIHLALHPLVTAFVRSLCTEQRWATIFADAQRAHAQYYASLVVDQPFFQNPHYTATIAWLQQNFTEVTSACQTLLAKSPRDAVPLLHVITMYGQHFGDLPTVQLWLERGLAALPTTLPARFRLLLDYVTCTTDQRDLTTAEAALAEARNLMDTQDDQAALIALYERLGWAAHVDYAAATPQRRQEGWRYFSRALELAEAMGNQPQVANLLAQRAFLASWDPVGFEQAQADLQRALAIGHQLGQPSLLVTVYKFFGYVEFTAGHFLLAQRYNERAMQLLGTEASQSLTRGWLCTERSQIALAQRDVTAARQYLRQAEQIFGPAKYEAGLTQCNTLQGIIALQEGDLTAAERYWLRAYKAIYQMSQQDKLAISIMVGIGVTQLVQGDPMLGAQLITVARAQYEEKAFHWVPPEQRLMGYLLERAEAEREALALPPLPVDEQWAMQTLRLIADSPPTSFESNRTSM